MYLEKLQFDGAFVWRSDVIAAAADSGLELQHLGEEMIPGVATGVIPGRADAGLELQHLGEEMIPGPPPGGPSLGAESPPEAAAEPPFGVPGNTVPLAASARLVDYLT